MGGGVGVFGPLILEDETSAKPLPKLPRLDPGVLFIGSVPAPVPLPHPLASPLFLPQWES